ncbi:MAG TPA: hypothetical protein VJM10_01330, partial [Candidatus Methylomirabilis sp.]|nr:hypothetical protein [Candidatus Methylomirabilis sp.]
FVMLPRAMTLAFTWTASEGAGGPEAVWEAARKDLEPIRREFREAVPSIIGEATGLMAPRDEGNSAADRAGVFLGIRHVHRCLTRFGPLYHYPGESDGNGYLLLSSEEDFRDFTLNRLPQTDLVLQRLARESAYFEDQRKTVTQEMQDVDREVNQLLHRKVVAVSPDPATFGELESAISRLAKIYGLLATDLQIIRSARGTLGSDLQAFFSEIESILVAGDGEDPLSAHYRNRYGGLLRRLEGADGDLQLSLRNAQGALGLLQAQVELFRGSEVMAVQSQTKELLSQNLLLQRERSALQLGAQVVEFVVVLYYGLQIWRSVASLEGVPPLLELGLGVVFSGSAVGLTHFIASALTKHNRSRAGLFISIACLVASIAGMGAASSLLAG